MHSSSVSFVSQRLPSPALRRFAWGVLAYFIAVILWGTLVRATGSGAGCGNHWPLCNGTVLQHSASVNTMIEFTHRITSGLSLFAVVGLLAWTFTGTVRGHLARIAAVASVAFTLIEAILGALLVKLGYTAGSQSPLRPAFLALHLTNTLLLLAALTLTAHLLSRSKGYLRGSIRLRAPFTAVAGIFVVMIVGVTGSLAALGDTLFPASSLGLALAQDIPQNTSVANAPGAPPREGTQVELPPFGEALTFERHDVSARVKPFALSQVRLTAGPMHDAQEWNRDYLHRLSADRLLHNFRVAGNFPAFTSHSGIE